MSIHRDYTYKRRRRSPLGYFLPIGGLLLWAGVLVVAWVSLEQSPPETVAREQSPESVLKAREPVAPRDTRPSPVLHGGQDTPDSPAEYADTRRKPKPSQEPQVTAPEEAEADAGIAPAARIEQQQIPKRAVSIPEDAPPSEEAAEKPSLSAKALEGISTSKVARAQFTTGIEGREPVNRVGPVFHTRNKSLRRVYYFTEIRGLSGETVTHRWELEGRVLASVSFDIGGDHWRVYSSKKLIPRMTGRWRVIVTDSHGRTLKTDSFVYKAP